MIVPVVILELKQELTVEPVTRPVVQGDNNTLYHILGESSMRERISESPFEFRVQLWCRWGNKP